MPKHAVEFIRIYFVHVELILQTEHHTMQGVYNIKKL